MGDSEKAAKLAAAKKKLKQFQQRGRSSSPRSRTVPQIITQSVENNENHVEEDSLAIKPIETLQLKDVEASSKSEVITDNNAEPEICTINGNANDDGKTSITKDHFEELRVQLAAHANTISILVSEKNELLHLLNESQHEGRGLKNALESSDTKITESNTFIHNLEERNQQLQQTVLQLEQRANELESKVKEERQEEDSLLQENEDLKEELSQLRLRLSTQDDQMKNQLVLNEELKSQVEVLEINIQQLKTAGPPTVDQSIEKLTKECEKLSEECSSYKEQVAKIATERDVLSQQYQQYILRLNGQIRTLTSQVESFSVEKRNLEAALLLNKEQVTELEELIGKLRNERDSLQQEYNQKKEILIPLQQNNTVENETLQNTIDELKKNKSELVMDNEQLSRLVIEKENRLQEMQIRIERLETELKTTNFGTGHDSNVDREKLVQAMQSDKLAASRAIAQNRQLKSQLEELEKAFISLSNDKLQLTEHLQAAQFSSGEAREKLSVMEPELLRLREEVAKLGEQRDATIYWQRELEEAHERIHALTHQNNELKKRVIWNIGHLQRVDSHDETSNHSNNCSENHNDHNNCSGHHDSGTSVQKQFPWEEFEKVKFTLNQLETRFERAMGDIARLNDEKHKLEHLVLQLQSETETIGEYVTLYQIQRGVLRQRAQELTLARDNLKQQLTELARLMVQLVPQLGAQPLWNQLSQLTSNMDQSETASDDTIVRVTDLLEKIHASNLVTAQDNSLQDVFHFEDSAAKHGSTENFHPCHVCSGSLIDV